MFGNQLGIALGFVLPALVVRDQHQENFNLIGEDLFRMFLAVAIFTSVLLLVIIFGQLRESELVGLYTLLNTHPHHPHYPIDISIFTTKFCRSFWCYIVVLAFKDQPPTPSNRAQELRAESQQESYLQSIKNLCRNPGYILLLITYGMNVGVFYAISTLLNTTVVKHFSYDVSQRKPPRLIRF